jgi:hypothetical protein
MRTHSRTAIYLNASYHSDRFVLEQKVRPIPSYAVYPWVAEPDGRETSRRSRHFVTI